MRQYLGLASVQPVNKVKIRKNSFFMVELCSKGGIFYKAIIPTALIRG